MFFQSKCIINSKQALETFYMTWFKCNLFSFLFFSSFKILLSSTDEEELQYLWHITVRSVLTASDLLCVAINVGRNPEAEGHVVQLLCCDRCLITECLRLV